jgi:hypothetical protein
MKSAALAFVVLATIGQYSPRAAASDQAPSRFVVPARKARTAPVLDGDLGDSEWTAAAVVDRFVQYEPRRGAESARRTEALVQYDTLHLYVAFRVWDEGEIAAQLTQRDADLLRDDAVTVVLDTFHDRRTAYYFVANALGTQADGRIADDGRSVDGSWDAPWKVATRRTGFGWTAEFAIPLASLRYVAGKGRTWGINLGRSHRRTLEISYWAGPLENQHRISQAGRLDGLELPAPARRHQVIPYGLSRLQQHERSDWDAGLDARYGLTPQMALYGTILPDFATVEADQETINLTRFEVSLREKRQFFLEGQELFGQRIRTFYSRRIADIAGGGKLLGRQGPWTLAAFSVVSAPIDGDRANYTVARAQRDILGRSNVALMVSNRRLRGVDEGAVEIDSNLLFTKTFGFTGQLIKTHGRFGQGTWAWFVRPSYDTPTGHFHVRYTHLGDRVGDNLNPVGQIRDDDRRELDSAVEKTFWRQTGLVQRIDYGSNYNVYWGQNRDLRSWQIDEGIEIELRNRVSVEVDYTEEFKRFEKDFRNRQVGVQLGYNTREYQSVRAGYEFGRNFDADYDLWTAAARRKLTERLSTEYELQRLSLRPDPEGESTWIHVMRANHSFTKDLFLRVFFQTNSAIDRRNVQALFVYRYLPPFGTLQIAYQRGTAAFGQRSTQGHTLFLKATTVF